MKIKEVSDQVLLLVWNKWNGVDRFEVDGEFYGDHEFYFELLDRNLIEPV